MVRLLIPQPVGWQHLDLLSHVCRKVLKVDDLTCIKETCALVESQQEQAVRITKGMYDKLFVSE